MALLTDQIEFTGTPAENDLVHMVDVSDTSQNPAGSSYKVAVSKLRDSYWTSNDDAVNVSAVTATTIVHTPNITNTGHVKTGGVHVATNVSFLGTTVSVTEDDYYLRSNCDEGSTTYNLQSSPPDGQILVISKQGSIDGAVIVNSPVASSIKACGDDTGYNQIRMIGTNVTVTILYDATLGAWITVSTCGQSVSYATTI